MKENNQKTDALFEQKRYSFRHNKGFKICLTLISILILSSSINYAALQIKTYGNVENESVNKINGYIEKYDIKGLKWILIYPDNYSKHWAGYYYPSQIRLYSSEEWIFVHELAHHYECMELHKCIHHDDDFYIYEEKIWQSIN